MSVTANINTSNIVALNRLQLGTQIGYRQIKDFGLYANYRNAAKSFNCKLIRFFDREVDGNTPFYSFVTWDEAAGTGMFNWTTVDRTIRAMFAIGAEPLIALGVYWHLSDLADPNRRYWYIPPNMAINPATGIPYPATWAKYCAAWVQHFKDVGIPVRFYEIVNEPDTTNQTLLTNYMAVVNATVPAMKAINPNVSLSFDRICAPGGAPANWIAAYWLSHGGVDLDSIDYHQYNCGTIDTSSQYYYDDPTVFLRSETFYEWMSNALLAKDAQDKWFNARGTRLPIFNTECNLNSAWDGGTDRRQELMTGAVWLAITLRQEILLGVDYHIYFVLCGSFGYEYNKKSPTNPAVYDGLGFGFINRDDWKPYIPYYVYQYIGNNLLVGDPILETSCQDARIRVMAWTNNNKLHIMLVNKTHDPIAISLQGVVGKFNLLKVDESIPSPIPDPSVDRTPITGIVDSTQPIVLNGYTVAFLQQAFSGKKYLFSHWQDGDKTPIKTVII